MADYNIEIIRSHRKTVAAEIKPDLSVIVRAPLRMKAKDIERFIAEKRPWIETHLERMQAALSEAEPAFTDEEIRLLTERAKAAISARAEFFAPVAGVALGKITVRHQVSRWGSCSGKGNLSFNCLLMLCPPRVLDYVVVHELCHLLEPNHSARFWAQVARVMPDYKEPQKWLKQNGGALINRIR